MSRSGRKEGSNSTGPANMWDSLRALGGEGRPLTRFTRKRPPQLRSYRVHMETREILFAKPGSDKNDRVVVDLSEVRELREGQKSKDFEKWPQQTRDHKESLSFILLHGNEFNLKTFSVVVPNDQEYSIWVRGLRYLIDDAKNAPYPVLVKRWLTKEFRKLESKSHMVSFKDARNWLTKICLKPGTRFKDIYQEIDPSGGDINFDQFHRLYRTIIFQSGLFMEYFTQFLSNSKTMSLEDFLVFLKSEQKEAFADDMNKVRDYIKSYIERDVTNLQLSPHEFLDYLYSKHNQVCTLVDKRVTQDMNRPLSHYWISSSHNTYLTGDQITSDSSCEAYVRALQAGCKCIELDCWDGDREPIIYHGRTLTSKILFREVLETIRDHAWDVSEYPLVLSIENHCSLPQQRLMADMFKKILGRMLLTEPVRGDPTWLPSPNNLRHKIIIKHKKLHAGADEFVSLIDEVAMDDMSESNLTGLLYLQDPADQIWKPHYFVLTGDKLLFTEETELKPTEDEADEEEGRVDENWFHSGVDKEQTLQLLEHYGPKLGNGAFLVRHSTKKTTDSSYSLSFWRNGKVHHCRINTTMEDGQLKYSFISNYMFDNLQSLVSHYKQYPLHCREFQQMLTYAISPQGTYPRSDWYHENCNRGEATDLLSRIPFDGAFLIRRREENKFAISFRAEGKIKHCRFTYEDGAYCVGHAQFNTMEEIVEFYRKTPLYRKMKFRYPGNRDLVAQIGMAEGDSIYVGYNYVDPDSYMSELSAKALYDYTGKSDSELSFKKGDIIFNINRVHEESWWRGDMGDKRQCWFPKNYVEEIDSESSLGTLQQGEVFLKACSVVEVDGGEQRFANRFRITTPEGRSVEVACWTKEEVKEWVEKLRENITIVTAKALTTRQRERQARKERLAVELSDLVVYCQTVDFDPTKEGPAHEMSSLAEGKAEKWSAKRNSVVLNNYNTRQISRVYPKGKRIDSSNYNPIPMWVSGCQLVALNFQTADLPMQLNRGKFLENGNCGYVLKPDFMNKKNYDPMSKACLKGVEPLSVSVTVLGARHIPRRGRDIPSVLVECDIHGCPYDFKYNKSKTSVKIANGLNPVWRESAVFDISNPQVALIRFVALDSDVFGDPNFLGEATYPVLSLRSGYRSVPLLNGYGEEIPLAALLIHIDLCNPQEDYQEVYTSIQVLQEENDQLASNLEQLRLAGKMTEAFQVEKFLKEKANELEDYRAKRQDRIKQKKRPVVKQRSAERR